MGECSRRAIAPVTYIWRPESKAEEERQMWLWVHAAAFEEALTCLQLLCQKQRACGRDKLQCRSRKGQMGRLDLLGSDANSILHKVLHPVVRQTSQPCDKLGSLCSHDSSSGVSTLRCLESSGGAVVGMEVWDPRNRPDQDIAFQPSILVDAGSDEDRVENIDSTNPNSGSPSTFDHVVVNTLETHLLGNRGAWDWLSMNGQEGLVKPLSEKDLSIKRHKRRLSYIRLDDTSEDIQQESTIAGENSKCHILVIKHAHAMPSACGFSLIMPIAWVRAFWVPLVFAGGRAIGLRERHWLHTDAKLASFPHDYPDCYSYDQHMASKALEYQEIYSRRPPSKRGIWRSELPDWKFLNEAPQLCSENCSTVPNVLTAEFETGISCGAVAAVAETDPSKTSNNDLVLLSSSGPAAPVPQLNTCSTSHYVQAADPDAGIIGATAADDSRIDSTQPGIDAHVFLPSRGLTDQILPGDAVGYCSSDTVGTVPMEVLDKESKPDNTVEFHEEGSSQVVPTPMAIELEDRNDSSGATLDAFISAEKPVLSLEAHGEIEESKNLKVDFVEAAVGERDLSGGGKAGEPSMFVARTKETLQQTLKDCSLHHLPLLTSSSGEALDTNGHSTLQLAGDGSAELIKKGCLVRVLIHAPRKGVFDEEAMIYLPLSSDVDSYFSSPQKWQGFEDPSFHQVQQSSCNKRKKRKQIFKGEGGTPSHGSIQSQNASSQTVLPRPRSEFCSLRVPIGIVTSAMVRGSKSSLAIGVCEVAALGVLRARQMADKRWSSSSDIFLLARNKCSSIHVLIKNCNSSLSSCITTIFNFSSGDFTSTDFSCAPSSFFITKATRHNCRSSAMPQVYL
uniref:POPLD domain-containing protein n=1 Tax=Physcomitrium patens TaxID=3218 RepID=A0A7I4D8V0_PHYPA